MEEEVAYNKAIDYVNVIENNAYLKLKKVLDSVVADGADVPFADPTVAEEVAKWNEALKGKTYDELELADQGEIDFLIQTKILGWEEVQRERRMRDPIIVMQFDILREKLFPKDEEVVAREAQAKREKKIRDTMADYRMDPEKMCTKAPFFAEDYIEHFKRIQAQPDLRKWKSDDRSDLSRWIVETLAIRDFVETEPNHRVQKYLNDLRVQFFPMIHFPDRAASFQTATRWSSRRRSAFWSWRRW